VTVATVTSIWFVRSIPFRHKACSTLLLGVAVSMLLVLSKRHFTIHYSIFCLAPMGLSLALALAALSTSLCQRHPASLCARWVGPAVALLCFALVLTARPRAQQYYANYQDDAQMPVSELTLTLIFDHDSLTKAYLKTMAEHYGDRSHFRAAINRYLDDVSHRY